MEITSSMLYWILMLDNINMAIPITFISIGIIFLLVVLVGVADYGIEGKTAAILTCTATILFLISMLVWAFLPTTKQMAAIYVIPEIVNNESVQEIPKRVLDLGMEWIEELKPERE